MKYFLISLVVMLFCIPVVGEASILTEFAEDVTQGLGTYAPMVIDATSFAMEMVTAPDGVQYVYVAGDRGSNVSVGLQKKFGGYQGTPFLGTIGILTKEPSRGRLAGGLGTRVGSVKQANLNAYLTIVPDELAFRTIPLYRRWAVAGGIGISYDF